MAGKGSPDIQEGRPGVSYVRQYIYIYYNNLWDK